MLRPDTSTAVLLLAHGTPDVHEAPPAAAVTTPDGPSPESPARSIAVTFLLTLSNPMTILSCAALIASIRGAILNRIAALTLAAFGPWTLYTRALKSLHL